MPGKQAEQPLAEELARGNTWQWRDVQIGDMCDAEHIVIHVQINNVPKTFIFFTQNITSGSARNIVPDGRAGKGSITERIWRLAISHIYHLKSDLLSGPGIRSALQ
jgi:hypothetical protein